MAEQTAKNKLITWESGHGTMFRTGLIPGAPGWWCWRSEQAKLYSPEEQARVALMSGERWADPEEHGLRQPEGSPLAA